MNIDYNDSVITMFPMFGLAALFVVSFLVIRTDLAEKRIPNRIILSSILFGACLFIVMLVIGLLHQNGFIQSYVLQVFINTAISFMVGYLLYHTEIWSPGDGKFFTVVAMLIPLKTYQFQYIPYFPSVVILVNAYVIAFLILTFHTILTLAARGAMGFGRNGMRLTRPISLPESIRKAVTAKSAWNICFFLLLMVSTLLAMRVFFEWTKSFVFLSSPIASFVMLLILYFAISRIMPVFLTKPALKTGMIAIFLLILALNYMSLGSKLPAVIAQIVVSSFFIIVFVPLAKIIIEQHSKMVESTTVERLTHGMALNEDTTRFLWEEKQIAVPANELLTDEQVQSIKNVFPNNTPVRRTTHISFAPYIGISAVFTLLFGRTVMHFL